MEESKDERKVISQILKEKRNWIESNIELPQEGKPVVIRLCHRTLLSGETMEAVYPLEDIKVGKYIDGNWVILPPYPKYDYSPLSLQGDIRKDVDITHWAELEEGELVGWTTRFDLIGTYDQLELHVDPKNEQEVYRALLWGSSMISQHAPIEMKRLSNILCDLQHCIDFGNSKKE